jgi:glutaredoxin-like protein
MMPLLQDKDKEVVKTQFQEELANPVKLVNFTQALECQFCAETRQLVEEVAALSDKIELEVYNLAIDKEKVEEYGVDKIPAIAIMGEKDYGVRYYGIPSGYEFSSLIEDIIDVSKGEVELLPATKEALAGITEPLHFQVFVTPTCPYCPQAVRLAHKLAIESDNIRADMVEAVEFPHLAIKYNVRGVPRVVINETIQIEGAVPEPMLMAQLQEALKPAEGEP